MIITKDDTGAYGDFAHELYFVNHCKVKCILESKMDITPKQSSIEKILSFLDDNGFEMVEDLIVDKDMDAIGLVNINEKIYVRFTGGFKNVKIYCESRNKFYQKIIKFLQALPKDRDSSKINVLVKNSSGFETIEFDSKKVDINFDDYQCSYDLKEFEKIVKDDTKAGLILLSGLPGTGKTYLLRYLCNNLNKKFVFLTNQVVGQLSDPSFLGFAIEDLKNCILIVEDAETCLVDRKKGLNDSASTLLNITDGLLGDLLNLKIIATINNEELVDSALLRKGRLLAKVDFDLLPPDKANRVLKRLKKKSTVDKATSLADLYNIDSDNGVQLSKSKIGFR